MLNKICPGNLTYHFKTRAILVREIYGLMYSDSQDFIKPSGYLTLANFRQTMELFRDFKKKYHFFFLDIAFIVRNYPEVGKLIEDINLKRFQQARKLFEYFKETDRMIPEKEGINYDFLTHNIWSVSAFWDVQSSIISTSTVFQKNLDMIDMTWYMILPYLTKKGKEEYQQIEKHLRNQA